MRNLRLPRAGLRLLAVFLSVTAGWVVSAAASDAVISRYATIDGIKVHYLTAGHGPTVILLRAAGPEAAH
jgi:hypothetical protein